MSIWWIALPAWIVFLAWVLVIVFDFLTYKEHETVSGIVFLEEEEDTDDECSGDGCGHSCALHDDQDETQQQDYNNQQ